MKFYVLEKKNPRVALPHRTLSQECFPVAAALPTLGTQVLTQSYVQEELSDRKISLERFFFLCALLFFSNDVDVELVLCL